VREANADRGGGRRYTTLFLFNRADWPETITSGMHGERAIMYDNLAEIKAIIGIEAESWKLEFKDGAKLDKWSDKAKSDLIADVTAFANAGGGTLIIGLSEDQRDNKNYAGGISPVMDPKMTQDRLREIIVSNTDPVLSGFSITHIPANGGAIFVINIEEGYTAYQNTCDRKFYGRIDASAQPMYCFAIRDVMNRRTRPHVTASFKTRDVTIQQTQHQYALVGQLKNEGNLTANHWALRVAIPEVIGTHDGRMWPYMKQNGESRIGGVRYAWYRFLSERPDGQTLRILPGETLNLREAFSESAELLLSVGNAAQMRIMQHGPAVYWELFVDDAPKQDGSLPYEDWCHF
jgi:hypothetical protein